MPAAPRIGAPELIGVCASSSRPITESSLREYTTSRAFSGIDSFWIGRGFKARKRARRRSISCLEIRIVFILVLPLRLAPVERDRRGRALALPLLLVDHLAEEVELDGDVVRVLEEDLEQLRVGEAAEVHRDLALLDALAHRARVLGQEGDVIDRAGSGWEPARRGGRRSRRRP